MQLGVDVPHRKTCAKYFLQFFSSSFFENIWGRPPGPMGMTPRVLYKIGPAFTSMVSLCGVFVGKGARSTVKQVNRFNGNFQSVGIRVPATNCTR